MPDGVLMASNRGRTIRNGSWSSLWLLPGWERTGGPQMSSTRAIRWFRHAAAMLLLTGAFAATAPTLTASAAAAPVRLTDVNVRSAVSTPRNDSTSTKEATATCLPGQRALSGGAKVLGPSPSQQNTTGQVELV